MTAVLILGAGGDARNAARRDERAADAEGRRNDGQAGNKAVVRRQQDALVGQVEEGVL